VDQNALYMLCAILWNSPGCTNHNKGRIYSDSPPLKHSLQSKFQSLTPSSRFFLHFNIHRSLFTSGTNSFGAGCSDMVERTSTFSIPKKKPL